MDIKLLTEHNLEFLSLKGGCTDLSESTLVKTPYCWKSHKKSILMYFFLLDVTIAFLIVCHVYYIYRQIEELVIIK